MSPDRPVILVHGLVGTLADPAIAAALAPRPSLAPDLLGYGALGEADPAEITLDAQVERVREAAEAAFGREPVHVVGHSVGGVVAMLFADRYPERAADLVSVEGNFTLQDAFWTSAAARMRPDEAEAMLDGWRADPAAWLARSGIPATPASLAAAATQLARQPASTLQAVGRSTVAVTSPPAYLDLVQRVFARRRVHLLAGERSRAGWDVPAWALGAAASETVLPGRGHLMPLEEPAEFGRAVAAALASR